MKHFRIFPILVFLFASALLYAAEPVKPVTDAALDPVTEGKINALVGLPAAEAVAGLHDVSFISDKAAMDKAIFKAFGGRRQEALGLAVLQLSTPLAERKGAEVVNRTVDFNIAKRIVEVFPGEGIGPLQQLYRTGDALTRANVIRASGLVSAPGTRELLMSALDDKTPVPEFAYEMMGEPLRICDHAYNQLVLRYGMQQVLRTIGTAHAIEIRDYHIAAIRASAR